MSKGDLRGRVLQALAGVRHPETGRDVVESGHVQGLEVSETGDVRFSFGIQADDPGGLVREARGAVEALGGIGTVKINVTLPQSGQGEGGPRTAGAPPSAVAGRGLMEIVKIILDEVFRRAKHTTPDSRIQV